MDMLKELCELKETVADKIAEANKKIRQAGGKMDASDVEIIDKLSHSMKSLVTTCAMLEAEENGYSEDYMPTAHYPVYGTRYSRDEYSGNHGGYSRNESRYSRENRNHGYSRAGDMTEQLRQMMDDAPDDVTRMEIKKLMDRMVNQR